MLLSEAIRLGAMLAPQSFNKFYDSTTQATCALGAAAQAVNTLLGEPLNAEQRYPWSVKIISVYCPKCGGKFKCAAEVIIHLNDAHHWSRTRIADLVEVLELNFSVQESEALSKKTDAFKAVIEKLPFAIKALAWLAGFAVFILPFSGFTSQFLVIFFLSGAILFLIDASCHFLRRTGAPQPEGGGAPKDFSTGHEAAGTALENITVHCPQCQAKFKNLVKVIAHLNDGHRWSREAIADLVEALELNFGVQDSEAQTTEARQPKVDEARLRRLQPAGPA